jgi:hypothetical protein
LPALKGKHGRFTQTMKIFFTSPEELRAACPLTQSGRLPVRSKRNSG